MTRVTEMTSRTTGLHGLWKILRHLVKDITSTTVEHLTVNSRQVLTRGWKATPMLHYHHTKDQIYEE